MSPEFHIVGECVSTWVKYVCSHLHSSSKSLLYLLNDTPYYDSTLNKKQQFEIIHKNGVKIHLQALYNHVYGQKIWRRFGDPVFYNTATITATLRCFVLTKRKNHTSLRNILRDKNSPVLYGPFEHQSVLAAKHSCIQEVLMSYWSALKALKEAENSWSCTGIN